MKKKIFEIVKTGVLMLILMILISLAEALADMYICYISDEGLMTIISDFNGTALFLLAEVFFVLAIWNIGKIAFKRLDKEDKAE
mgnify:CR=1 FL=1